MTIINLKFSPEMEELVLQGKKCCTTRDEIKGNIGDLFRVKDRMYRIIQVDESDLFYSSAMANAEGFKSDIEYLDCMCGIYPDLVECSPVFIHYFAYAGPWCPNNNYIDRNRVCTAIDWAEDNEDVSAGYCPKCGKEQ